MPRGSFLSTGLHECSGGALSLTGLLPLVMNCEAVTAVQSGAGYVMWNDEFPGGAPPVWEAAAHAKGVMGFDATSAFYLLHSLPKFPSAPCTDCPDGIGNGSYTGIALVGLFNHALPYLALPCPCCALPCLPNGPDPAMAPALPALPSPFTILLTFAGTPGAASHDQDVTAHGCFTGSCLP